MASDVEAAVGVIECNVNVVCDKLGGFTGVDGVGRWWGGRFWNGGFWDRVGRWWDGRFWNGGSGTVSVVGGMVVSVVGGVVLSGTVSTIASVSGCSDRTSLRVDEVSSSSSARSTVRSEGLEHAEATSPKANTHVRIGRCFIRLCSVLLLLS